MNCEAENHVKDEGDVLLPDVERRRKKKKKHDVTRIGDKHMILMENDDSATWREIWDTCFVHNVEEWIVILAGLVAFAACLYLYLLGYELIGSGAQVLTGCKAGSLFGNEANPLSSLMIGILVTVLLQSSSTALAIITSLVQIDKLSVAHAIYLVMGANIGTTITSTIASLVHMKDSHQLERAFAAGTVHDMFNFMTVAVLFPLEIATGYLEKLTSALVDGAETGRRNSTFLGPIKRFVSPLAQRIIISNKKVTQEVAMGASCDSFYPIICDPDLEPSYKSCRTGLIGCDKDTNRCPMFFDEHATPSKDQISGAICMFLGYILLFASLLAMVYITKKLLFGVSTKVIYTVSNCNGYIGIIFGVGITMLIQSSAVVTSILVPFAGLGALRMNQIYPIVVGANIGTAVQATIRSLDIIGRKPLQVALSHLFFNLTGAVLFYPLPFTRAIPVWAARRLGRGAYLWRYLPLAYIAIMFFVMPLFFLGISTLFRSDHTGDVVAASLIIALVAFALFSLLIWCKFLGGDMAYVRYLERMTQRRLADDGSSSRTVHDGNSPIEGASCIVNQEPHGRESDNHRHQGMTTPQTTVRGKTRQSSTLSTKSDEEDAQ